MIDTAAPTVRIDGYHGHIYYSDGTRAVAQQLRETIAAGFGVEVRGLSDDPVGPHPAPQFRFTFAAAQFATIVPWLMFNRRGLDVLVHPLTDDSHADHSRYVIWLGTPVALKLDTLRGGYRAEQYPAS
jgi:DOPA 4,5-dioxygenase